MNLTDRLITAIVEKCDGLSITAEQASNILAYLQYGTPLNNASPQADAAPIGQVPCGWIRGVESYVPGEPTEWNVEFSWGDDEPEDGHKWEPVYRAAIAAGGAQEPVAFNLLAALIDILDDADNNAPEYRCYVEGAWQETLDEARTLIAGALPREVATVATTDEAIIDALKSAKQFIANGIALGYIRMPDADCPDPAHDTPKKIDTALAILAAASNGEQ